MHRHGRGLHRATGAASAALALATLTPAGALASAPYQNPFAGDRYLVGRTDMGVDVCLHHRDPIRAVGNGVVTGIIHGWFGREPYLWYQLTGGPQAGRYVYVAEQINHLAHIGHRLHTGQPVARFSKRGTCIETGWSASDGSTMAQTTTGYTEGQVTRAGVSFAQFLIGLGVDGEFQLHPTHGHGHQHGHRPE
ncbi:MAG TPA: hypothetical protein VGF70_13255 [Solirubrobacteraceae bacterium]|jgi:hypothetical protein